MTLEDLELMPEPEDSRLLTAVDPQAPGYPGSEYGLSDQEARELRWPLGPMKEFLWPWGAASFAIGAVLLVMTCLLYTSPSPRDMRRSRMPSSA